MGQRCTKERARRISGRGHPFDLVKEQAAKALEAETEYNATVLTRGIVDEVTLARVVREHMERYPYGIDPKHPRPINGYAHVKK